MGRGLGCGQDFLGVDVSVDQFSNSKGRIQFDKVDHAELNVKTCCLLLQN
jgi:hypothetical protein